MVTDGDAPIMQYNLSQDAKIADLERKVAMLERELEIIDGARESLRETVNKNAAVANDNALQNMTKSGACGTERVDYPDGSWTFRNRKCTKADFK